MAQAFQGFNEDTYKFLIELAFNNNKEFYHANQGRYRANVKAPMEALALDLLPTALDIDPSFNTRMTSILSRIYRDTRFTKDKRPYRDHAWLGFRRPGQRLSEGIVLYFEITPQGYGYGMGMYGGNPEAMAALRQRILADPAGFRALVMGPGMEKYALTGPAYKRDHTPPGTPEELKPYLNHKGIGWECFHQRLTPTLKPELLDEVRAAFLELGPLYRFCVGM